MRHFDPSRLYRSTVGFDRLFTIFDQLAGVDGTAQTYPPYNIEKTGENAYRITVAAAGFAESELAIETREGLLTIRGDKAPKGENAKENARPDMLFQGIAARAFERQFQLADHVHVAEANLENGLLHVDLVREVPEAKRPKLIPIGKSLPKRIQMAAAA